MYERFTDRARKVMQLANQEAQRLNHSYIDTGHILLGIVEEGSGVAANVLANLGINLRKIRLEMEKIVQSGPDMVTMGKLPQTPRAKKVIEYSIEEARNLNHNYVGTEHLLLGLLREQEGVAAQVLMNLGLQGDAVRAAVLNLLGHAMDSPEASPAQGTEPDAPVPASRDLATLFELLQEKKEAAVADKDFEKAARLRDIIDSLRKEFNYPPGSGTYKAGKLLKEYDFYIPLRSIDGSPVEPEKVARVRQHLMEQFGSLTEFHQRQEGVWKVGQVTFRDEIVIFRVLTEPAKGDWEFFMRLKEQLKADLGQEELLIILRSVNVL